jgi:hypothetical protein
VGHLVLSLLSIYWAASYHVVATEPIWEKLYEVSGPKSFIFGVWASKSSDWFVGGSELIWGDTAGVHHESRPEWFVEGFGMDDRGALLALGYDRLVLRFNHGKWIQEHLDRKDPNPRHRGILLSAQSLTFDGRSMFLAFGSGPALVRQLDGSWTDVLWEKRAALLNLTATGPPDLKKPAGCYLAGWEWLGPNQGWFDCHDGRAFMVNGNVVTPKGRLPKACALYVTRSAQRSGELYATCAEGTLWKTTEQTWKRIRTPVGMDTLALTDRCIFATTKKALWRSCVAP